MDWYSILGKLYRESVIKNDSNVMLRKAKIGQIAGLF